MSLTFNTNLSSLNSQRNLSKSQGSLKTSMERLASGLRINSAKDDAAGLAISDRMTSQIRGLNQAARNANDGISLTQTAEGAMQEGINILQRIRELAVQSANDTNSDNDRASLQAEVHQLILELIQIGNTTSFNNKKLLDGTFKNETFQVGANAGETVSIDINSLLPTDIGTITKIVDLQEKLGLNMGTSAWEVPGIFTGQTNNSTSLYEISGISGNSTVSVMPNQTAKDLIDQIEVVKDSTGVFATAETKVIISSAIQDPLTTYPSIWTFQLTGDNSTDVSVNLENNSSLRPLVDAINAKQETTGITALHDDTTGNIILTSTDGFNISIGNLKIEDSSGPFVTNLGYGLNTSANLISAPYTGQTFNDINPHIINGPDGDTSISLISNETANDLVRKIEDVTFLTGVSATAETKVRISSLAQDGSTVYPSSWTFKLSGRNTSLITAFFSDDSSMLPIVAAINDQEPLTGISAEYDAVNDDIILTNSDGYNITIFDLRIEDSSVHPNKFEYSDFEAAWLIFPPYTGQTKNDTTPYIINGPDGSATVSLSPNESAKDLAELLNFEQGTTGVTADAGTKVSIYSFNTSSYPSTWTVNLGGAARTDITFTLNNNSDLTPFLDAVSAVSALTNVDAIYEPIFNRFVLSNDEGYNISLGNLRVVDNNGDPIGAQLRLRGMDSEENPKGADSALDTTGIYYTVGGYIKLDANAKFTLEHNGTTYDSTGNPAMNGSLTFGGLNSNGSISGSNVTLDSNLTDTAYTVGGYIEYISDDSFSVDHSGISYNSTGDTPPDLNGSLVFAGLDGGGSVSGFYVNLDSGFPDTTYTVGGYLNFTSEESFTVINEGNSYLSIPDYSNPTVTIIDLTVSNIDISTIEGANIAISIVDTGTSQIDSGRGNLGAIQNRFESIISNLNNISDNLTTARSRIIDADIAMETSEMTKQNILQKAGVAILAQANKQPELALSLLQG